MINWLQNIAYYDDIIGYSIFTMVSVLSPLRMFTLSTKPYPGRQLGAGLLGSTLGAGRTDFSEGRKSVAAVVADLMVGMLSMIPTGIPMRTRR